MKARVSILVSCALLVAVIGCKPKSGAGTADQQGAPTDAKSDAGDILATVNGVPIRNADLQYVLASKARKGEVDAVLARQTLDKLIDEELARQAAERQGLHDDPEYLRKLHFMEAPVNDFQRETLSKAYFERIVERAAPVTEEQARAHFDENQDRYKVRYRMWQILVKGDDAKLAELKQRLDDGESFEAVAATLFPPELAATGQRPWDLGELGWDQLPASWQTVVPEMKDGEVSDILRGPNKRAWIVKLVERVRDESVTFESAKEQIMSSLASARGMEQARTAAKQLRREAKIVHVRAPGDVGPIEDDR